MGKKFYAFMRAHGMVPDARVCAHMVRIYATDGDFQGVNKLWEETIACRVAVL